MDQNANFQTLFQMKLRMVRVLHDWLIPLAALLFFSHGGGEVCERIRRPKMLTLPDPVFGIPHWVLMIWAGTVEMAAAGFCLFARGQLKGVLALLWLTGALIAYRVMHGFSDAVEPCQCLGGLLDGIGLPQSLGDVFAISILSFASIVSFAGCLTFRASNQTLLFCEK